MVLLSSLNVLIRSLLSARSHLYRILVMLASGSESEHQEQVSEHAASTGDGSAYLRPSQRSTDEELWREIDERAMAAAMVEGLLALTTRFFPPLLTRAASGFRKGKQNNGSDWIFSFL